MYLEAQPWNNAWFSNYGSEIIRECVIALPRVESSRTVATADDYGIPNITAKNIWRTNSSSSISCKKATWTFRLFFSNGEKPATWPSFQNCELSLTEIPRLIHHFSHYLIVDLHVQRHWLRRYVTITRSTLPRWSSRASPTKFAFSQKQAPLVAFPFRIKFHTNTSFR